MITALIVALFVIQLITIFVIILLYSKVSKFKEIEIRQNQLVEEMDNAIGVYLMEMKEENNRLIEELKAAKGAHPVKEIAEPKRQAKPNTTVNVKKIFEELADNPVPVVRKDEVDKQQEFEPRQFVPVQKAATAYSKQKVQIDDQQQLEQVEAELFAKEPAPTPELAFEEQVVAHYKTGKSIEEIAKLMQRGKTEIELLVKFRA